MLLQIFHTCVKYEHSRGVGKALIVRDPARVLVFIPDRLIPTDQLNAAQKINMRHGVNGVDWCQIQPKLKW